MEMQRRMLYTPAFHIDTNLINSRGKLETMNQIEKWAADKVILVNMSGVSFKEAQAGGDLARTKKALSHIFTLTDESIDPNDLLYQRIEAALFPEGVQTENQRNDIKIVFEAAKYEAILITRDGGYSAWWHSWKSPEVTRLRLRYVRQRGGGIHLPKARGAR
ncbi:MAG: hypothetical protein ACREI9_13135 [Nitrospiraceae bacterium]